MMTFLPLKRHPFKLVDINGTIVIDVSDLYNILEAQGEGGISGGVIPRASVWFPGHVVPATFTLD